MAQPGLDDVLAAQKTLAGVARVTALEGSRHLSALVGAPVHLKCENLQRAGSFKLRGAYVRIAGLTAAERELGVVAASAGNHAQGMALAASLGASTLRVRRAPCVALLATGDELVLPGEIPGPDQIVASSHSGVASMATAAGASVSAPGAATNSTSSSSSGSATTESREAFTSTAVREPRLRTSPTSTRGSATRNGRDTPASSASAEYRRHVLSGFTRGVRAARCSSG